MGILISGIHFSQTYYSQDFNTTGLNNWTSVDLDGDTKNWVNENASALSQSFGTGSLKSNMYVGITNDLITSPGINLGTVTASNVALVYDLATSTLTPQLSHNKYSIYVTTSNNSGTITASTPVVTEEVAQGGVQHRSINLSAFIGQNIFISFRHYNSQGLFLVIDNIEVKTLASNDLGLTSVYVPEYGLINTNYPLKATIKNNGFESINTIALNWNDGLNDHISTFSVTPPLTTGSQTTITHPVNLNYALAAEKNITVTITQVNGTADSTPSDNVQSTVFRSLSEQSPKKVLIEEGTGTWCGHCPQGHVIMHKMTVDYPENFIGIAVHNSDPMQVSEYNDASAFSAFPIMHADRVDLQKFLTTTQNYINFRKNMLVPARLDASSSLSGNILTFNASATFKTVISNANLRLSAILVEDGVKGTTNSYAQRNYFAGGALGPMGGYENLPSPVPASQITYDNVGRMLIGGYTGVAGSIPSSVTDGQVVNYTFTATIPTTFNTSKLKVVLLLLNADTGAVINARSFLLGTLGTSNSETNANYLALYPNPASEYIKIQSDYKTNLKIYEPSGRLVLEKSNVAPDSPVSIEHLAKGTYLVSIKEKDAEPKTQKLIIK